MAKGVKHYFKDGTEFKGRMHKMPNGSMHSGVKHTKSTNKLSKWTKQKWKTKSGKESGKLLIILGVIVGMYYYISYACKGCI